jgi:DNA-binding NarL/FixJ family response regulator
VDSEHLRILVADDSEAFRAGLAALLASVDGVTLAGEATSGEEAIARALELQPDVVLMDLNMPGCNGIEATRAIVSSAPHIAVLVLTMHEDDESVFAAVQAGARGYLVKGAAQREILGAVRGVHAGQAVMGTDVARRLGSLVGSPAPEDPFPELTTRERQTLNLLAGGASTSQIADRLGLSSKTVRNHLSSIFTKLEAVDRTQAVLKARAAGLPR